MKYYVYQLVHPITGLPFYIGKGTGKRAYSHLQFKDGNGNPYKDAVIQQIYSQGLVPQVEILQHFDDESLAYDYEEQLIETIGLHNLTNLVTDARPPSRAGKPLSEETLAKRSRGLKGIPRTTEWKQNLSLAKQGKNNPMYGRTGPCTEARKLAVLKGKNANNYELYKLAISKLRSGQSADSVSRELSIGRGVCFLLKNGTHGIFLAYPELQVHCLSS